MADISEAASLFSDNFGNWILRDSVPIRLPEVINYFPQTWGWFVVACVLGMLLARYLLFRFKHYWRNRYRKQALAKLNQVDVNDRQDTPRIIHQLLQQTCVVAYSEHPLPVNRLHGQAFLLFLDCCTQGKTEFDSDLGRRWQQALYLPIEISQWSVAQNQVLLLLAQRWLSLHMAEVNSHD